MNEQNILRRTAAVGCLAVAALVGATACGSSTSDTASKGTTTVVTSGSTKNVSAADREFCSAWVDLDATANAGPETTGENAPTPDQAVAFGKKLQPLAAKVDSTAGDELADSTQAVKKLVDEAATDPTGKAGQALDPSNPELAGPLATIEKWVFQNCGFTQIDAMGMDYSFSGVPATIDAGTASIKFTNKSSDETHEMAVIKVKDGSDVTAQTIADALKKDTDAAQQTYGNDVDFVGDAEAEPGKTAYTLTDLTAGDYVIACFVPQGGKDGGTPHTELGMVGTFTVK